MKLPRLLLLLSSLLIPAALFAASHKESGAQKLTVNFPNWQHYTDIKDRYLPSPKGEWALLMDLKQSLEFDAKYDVPDGEHLTLTFEDIDLAGEFEPWHGAEQEDIRRVKAIYPPRFKFTYQLADAAGRVIRQGRENLTDLNFDMRLTLNTDDPLHFEKDILKEWMDRTVR